MFKGTGIRQRDYARQFAGCEFLEGAAGADCRLGVLTAAKYDQVTAQFYPAIERIESPLVGG